MNGFADIQYQIAAINTYYFNPANADTFALIVIRRG